MELYNLGKVTWRESQLIYHSMAYLGREGLLLVSPSTPYVCIGFHQDVIQEVDLEYCRTENIPVFRREVGGGAVFLDGNQLFFQIVLDRNNPAIPPLRQNFYRKFLQPVIDVYRRLGIQAEYKAINDVIVGNRKICGSGVGEIGDCVVFVGNLILDFDYQTMSRVLKVPDEKFRDRVKKTIEENLTTIRRELGSVAEQWDEAGLNDLMAEAFAKVLGPMTPGALPAEIHDKMDELAARMINDDWLHQHGRKSNGRMVKVRAGLNVVQRMHKAPGGLIRAVFEVDDGRFANVSLSGDFFSYPHEAVSYLASRIEGRGPEEIPEVLAEFYAEPGTEIPGVTAVDWLTVLNFKGVS